MRFLLLLLIFFAPAFSHAAVVPQWNPLTGLSYYYDSYYTASSTNPWLYLVPSSISNVGIFEGDDILWQKNKPIAEGSVPSFMAPEDLEQGDAWNSGDFWMVRQHSTVNPSTLTNANDWWNATGSFFYSNTLTAVELVNRSDAFCNFSAFTCPSTVYVGFGFRPKSSTDPDDFFPTGYFKLTLQSGSFGNNPIYTISAPDQENIFPEYLGPGSAFAIGQALKNAVAQNTVLPDCDFSELFESAFWSECVARSVINWLFVPSDSAIDALVEFSTQPNMGTTWSYVVLAPLFTAPYVAICEFENPSTCDIGAEYLSIPILDVNGSSTPYTINPPSLVPEYFDAFLASIIQAIMVAALSYTVIYRFL